jgi:hypothetical protein
VATVANPAEGFGGSVSAAQGQPYIVQASADLSLWTDIFTNLAGGDGFFVDTAATNFPARYYRSRSGDPADYSQVSVTGLTPEGGNIVRVEDHRLGSTVVWGSDNGSDWLPVYTRQATASGTHISVGQTAGDAELLNTFLELASPVFLETSAQGRRKFSINGTNTAGSYLALSGQLTNGTPFTVAVTNTTGLTDVLGLAQLLVEAINATPTLQGGDGLVAEDLIPGVFGAAEFNLRARAPGLPSANIAVSLASSTGITATPAGTWTLDENLSDLLPRNHVFVRAGLQSLAVSVPLDTTRLPDGYHELTAVAYEGTHVYSQTIDTVPVQVANSTLQATLALAEPSSTLPVTNSFNLVVTANTNNLGEILLFSTGGFQAGVTNQPAASFVVNGPDLGVGEHPFYALVRTTDGLLYRSAPLTVTLAP